MRSDAVDLLLDHGEHPLEVRLCPHYEGLDRLVVGAAAGVGDHDVPVVGHFGRIERDVDAEGGASMPGDGPAVEEAGLNGDLLGLAQGLGEERWGPFSEGGVGFGSHEGG